MAAKLGNTVKCYIGSGHTWLAGEQSNSVNRTQEAIEISDKSTDWAQYIPGKKGATIEVTAFADDSDTAQTELLTSLTTGTTVNVLIGSVGQSSSSGVSGTGIVTSISDTNDFGAVASRTFSITITGALS